MIARRDLAFIALLALITVVALAQSWNRWLDPIIDTGRDLYVSDQLAHGAKLYRDLRYQYPPLTPYLLAPLSRSLAWFTAIGIAQSIAIAVLLCIALRKTAGFAAALLFVSLSLTGASTWGANFIFPYAYAATIGMLFLIASLTAFAWNKNAFAIASLVLASWCKVEYAAAALLVVTVLVIARRIRLHDAVAYAAAMCVSAPIALAYFGHPLIDNVFAETLTKGEVARRFFRSVSGFDRPLRNVAIAVASAAAIVLIAWLLRTKSRLATVAVIIGAALFTSDSFFRGWAILQFVALIVGWRERESPLLLLAIFSIASTLRVALAVSPSWYGFALVVPVYALAAHVLFASEYRSQWWFAIVAVICLRDLVEQRERYALKQYPIVSSRGVFLDANPDRARIVNEVLRAVQGPTLAVMPEGVTMNYLTRRPTPLSFYMFTPPETADPKVESAVLAELKQKAPSEVLLVSRDVTEYGYRAFGVDYNRAIFSYVLQNYRVVRSRSSPRFEAVLLTHMSQ